MMDGSSSTTRTLLAESDSAKPVVSSLFGAASALHKASPARLRTRKSPDPTDGRGRIGATWLGGAQLPVDVLDVELEPGCVQGSVAFDVDFFAVEDDFV